MNDVELTAEEESGIATEQLPEAAALGSFTTVGSYSTFSCPTSSAGTASTYATLG